MKKLSEFLGIALALGLVLYLGWVFVAGNPDQRINRACRPIFWTGKVFEAMAMAGNTDYGDHIHESLVNMDQGCQLTIWDYEYAHKWCKYHPGQLIPGDKYERCPIPKRNP